MVRLLLGSIVQFLPWHALQRSAWQIWQRSFSQFFHKLLFLPRLNFFCSFFFQSWFSSDFWGDQWSQITSFSFHLFSPNAGNLFNRVASTCVFAKLNSGYWTESMLLREIMSTKEVVTVWLWSTCRLQNFKFLIARFFLKVCLASTAIADESFCLEFNFLNCVCVTLGSLGPPKAMKKILRPGFFLVQPHVEESSHKSHSSKFFLCEY